MLMSVDHQTQSDLAATDRERAVKLQQLMDSEPLPLIQQSICAFRSDLPELLKSHRGRWVAYHGEQRLGIGKTQTELYQQGFRRGLTRNDFIVGFIEPGSFDANEEFEMPYGEI
jgi:hypothetical protein